MVETVAPKVRVIGRQIADESEMAGFLLSEGMRWESDAASDGEYIAEAAGRLCYLSFARPRPGGNKAYLDHILEVGHGSVLEHAVWNLLVTGVSRSLSHELVRHRAGMGVSQLSQRYVDSSAVRFVMPHRIGQDAEAARIWTECVQHCQDAYAALTERLAATMFPGRAPTTEERKAARGEARSVLPNATETMLLLTLNARAARNIIEQRASRHADREIRVLAYLIWLALRGEAPAIFGDYAEAALPDGSAELVTKNRKV